MSKDSEKLGQGVEARELEEVHQSFPCLGAFEEKHKSKSIIIVISTD